MAARQQPVRRVCVGIIVGPHGVCGEVRIRSFTEPPGNIAAYGQVSDELGARSLRLHLTGTVKGQLIARIEGVEDRAAAERLKGLKLFVTRDVLPEPEMDEYYHADLIGLRAERAGNARLRGPGLGAVVAVQDYGAGPLLEISGGQAGPVLVPLTRAYVPWIDLAGGRIGIAVSPGLLSEASENELEVPDDERS